MPCTAFNVASITQELFGAVRKALTQSRISFENDFCGVVCGKRREKIKISTVYPKCSNYSKASTAEGLCAPKTAAGEWVQV